MVCRICLAPLCKFAVFGHPLFGSLPILKLHMVDGKERPSTKAIQTQIRGSGNLRSVRGLDDLRS